MERLPKLMTSDKAKPATPRQDALQRSVPDRAVGRQIAQAVRNSLNLPTLTVRVRRSQSRSVWLARLVKGSTSSEWLELDVKAVAVAASVGVLPPRLLGVFRLAYDTVTRGAETKPQRATRVRSS